MEFFGFVCNDFLSIFGLENFVFPESGQSLCILTDYYPILYLSYLGTSDSMIQQTQASFATLFLFSIFDSFWVFKHFGDTVQLDLFSVFNIWFGTVLACFMSKGFLGGVNLCLMPVLKKTK